MTLAETHGQGFCQWSFCDRAAVVTITGEMGGYLAHYPSCAVHIVAIANLCRRQLNLGSEQTPESLRAERDAVLGAMEELIVRAEREQRDFSPAEKREFESARTRAGQLDNAIRHSLARSVVASTVTGTPEIGA